MSKSNPANSTSGGIAPLDQPQAGQSSSGVFRLDSLAPGVESAEGLITPARKKISIQSIFLVALVLGGAGLIYAMRIVGIGPLTALAQTQMPDYDLTKPGSKTADHKKVLDQLSAANITTQVPVEKVQKNPFKMADVLASDTKSGNTEDAAGKANIERIKRDQDAKRRKVETALRELKLNGVIGGSNPVARISGQAVRVGDTVSEVFTVKAIHGRAVELDYEGEVHTLSLDDEDLNKNPNGQKKK